ncbi:MAG TPA: hypothetical protein DEP38_23890 [Cyanobacteria bacterium UBA9226]|nr:hypothetical protein [Cyanobacteria bacterium UBA9226]
MAEIATIHQGLKHHIARKNNQPIQPETHIPPEISAIPICPSQSQIVAEITETWLSFGNPTHPSISENQAPIKLKENKLYPLIQLCGKSQDNNEAIATHICTTLNL